MDTITAVCGALVFLFGITIGSFLNVCILRIPAGQSIVTGPSCCPDCGRRLKWYELVPILSWVCLRGKCHGCKRPISAQYPLIEAANGVLWLIVYASTGLNYLLPLCCLVASALLGLSVIDGRTQEIPPGFNLFILAMGIARLALDFANWPLYLIGLVCISLPLAAIFYISGGRGIGGGDVKLMAAAGLFLGWQNILLAFVIGCLLGSVIHIARMRLFDAGRQLALGPYLSVGIFAAMLWGSRLIGLYLGLFA